MHQDRPPLPASFGSARQRIAKKRLGAAHLAAFAVLSLVGAGGVRAESAKLALPEPITAGDYRPFDEKRAALGQLLFYDPLLSGNRNISCGTCHNHDLASGDGLSLGIGEGGVGLGPERRFAEGTAKPRARMSRNSSALFNLGHKSVRVLLHDGRVTADDIYGTGFNTPAEEWLPKGLQSVLAAQAIMPMAVPLEMAGDVEENDVAAARHERIDYAWPLILERIVATPAYVMLFHDAFDDIDDAGDIEIAHIGNALDDFINAEWRAYDSPFDRYLAGDVTALDAQQKEGASLFFGKAKCANCHTGPLLTDQDFHALAIPPFGPGRVRPLDPYARDVGHMAESDLVEDAYRFRTPPLRNVAVTGPWGHNGAYATLEGIVRHHLDPLAALDTWDPEQVVMPRDAAFAPVDFAIWSDSREMQRYRSRLDIQPVELTDEEVVALIAFLQSLTDDGAEKGRLGKPASVPSGLPVD